MRLRICLTLLYKSAFDLKPNAFSPLLTVLIQWALLRRLNVLSIALADVLACLCR